MGGCKALYRVILLFALAYVCASCSLPRHLLPKVAPSPEPTAAPERAWRKIADGLQLRKLIPNGDELAQLVVLRVDPSKYRFRAVYRPGQPENLSGWRALEPEASVIINANYFDAKDEALGLVVSDGKPSGVAYGDRGGAFLLRNGKPAIVTYRSQPWTGAGNIEQAVQGFPILVENGGQAYVAPGRGERARRTIIGIDRRGQVLIMVAPFLGLSLADLSAYLPAADLDIETAFNLDGGRSTTISLPDADYFQPSLDQTPTILAVYKIASG